MARFLNAIAAVAALAVIQGCSSLATQQTPPPPAPEAHAEHDTSTSTPLHAEGDTQNGTQATLITPNTIRPEEPTPLKIQVTDAEGRAIAQFDTFQEQTMHLIAVSEDLQVFQHLHPTYNGNGEFSVDATFPAGGRYTLFSDYQPTGQAEQISVLTANVAGAAPAPAPADTERARTLGNTRIHLALSAENPQAGEPLTATFHLQDAATQAPATDLQPYLGEAGHLVILRHSTPLTRASYIHAHALDSTDPSQVQFRLQFPEPGHYKLWGQFNRNGEIVTADFWVTVS